MGWAIVGLLIAVLFVLVAIYGAVSGEVRRRDALRERRRRIVG